MENNLEYVLEEDGKKIIEGTYTIKRPSRAQRLAIGALISNNKDNYEVFFNAQEDALKKFTSNIKIKHIPKKVEIDNIEDLLMYDEFAALTAEMFNNIIEGAKLGKS